MLAVQPIGSIIVIVVIIVRQFKSIKHRQDWSICKDDRFHSFTVVATSPADLFYEVNNETFQTKIQRQER